jgi:hypothetical protein
MIIKVLFIIAISIGIIFLIVISRDNICQIFKKNFEDLNMFLLQLYGIVILVIFLIIVISIKI